MAQRDLCPRHISRIVDFILDDQRVKVNWRILSLDEKAWHKA